MQQIPGLFIAPSDLGGRGVFTSQTIEKGSLIELAPVIVLPKKDMKLIHETHLHDYYFRWNEGWVDCAIALGYGSLYNHSFQPNARFECDFGNKTLDIYCHKNIEAGTEITINYNGEIDNQTPLWFHKNGKKNAE